MTIKVLLKQRLGIFLGVAGVGANGQCMCVTIFGVMPIFHHTQSHKQQGYADLAQYGTHSASVT